MTSKIKVDNINKVSDDSNIIKKCGSTTTVGSGSGNTIVVCGSTVTIGRCGGSVALASGASQTGFGRTGTVDWQTGAIKTGDFTAVNGQGFFVDTSSGAVAVTLPGSPSAGNIVAVKDYAANFDSNSCTINRNGSNIEGQSSNLVLNTEGVAATFVYVDATKGWLAVNSNDITFSPQYVAATGGTVTTSGDWKIHTFTGPGTFCVSNAGNSLGNDRLDYMVVAGGGGSATLIESVGGGGGGGFRESVPPGPAPSAWSASPLATNTGVTAAAQAYPVVVGAGGAAGAAFPTPTCPDNVDAGGSGVNSSALGITSAGGGGGGKFREAGIAGGSGGGGGGRNCAAGGAGNTPSVSPPQGNNGGRARENDAPSVNDAGGGGGGATAVGVNGAFPKAGDGGAGATTSISASPTAYAGGGGGGAQCVPNGSGGTGGGGQGGYSGATAANGTANTGGGAGGSSHPQGSNHDAGKAGGSGIVIIRYKYQN